MVSGSRLSIFYAIFLLTLSSNIHSMQQAGAAASEPDLGSICAICQEPLKGHIPALRLRCGHAFHQSCILGWINEHPTCPTCRQSIVAIADDPDIPAYLPPHEQQPVANSEPATRIQLLIASLQQRWNAWQTPRIRSAIITGLELITLAAMSRVGSSALKNKSTRLLYSGTLVPAIAAPFIPTTIAPHTVTNSIAIAWAARHLLYPHAHMTQLRTSAAGLATGFLAPTLAHDCYQRINGLLPAFAHENKLTTLTHQALAVLTQIATIGAMHGIARLLI